jgi:hypothetical protein
VWNISTSIRRSTTRQELQALWVGEIGRLKGGVNCKVLTCPPELLVDGVQLIEERLCQTVLLLHELIYHIQAIVLLLWIDVVTSNLPVLRCDDEPWWHVAEWRSLEARVVLAQQSGTEVHCMLHGQVDRRSCGLTRVKWRPSWVICRNTDHSSVEVLVLATRNLEHSILRVPDVAKETEHLAEHSWKTCHILTMSHADNLLKGHLHEDNENESGTGARK